MEGQACGDLPHGAGLGSMSMATRTAPLLQAHTTQHNRTCTAPFLQAHATQPNRECTALTLAAPADDAVLDEAEVLDGHPVQDDAVGQPHAVANLAAAWGKGRKPETVMAASSILQLCGGHAQPCRHAADGAGAAAGVHAAGGGMGQGAMVVWDSQLADGHVGANHAVLANLGGVVDDGVALIRQGRRRGAGSRALRRNVQLEAHMRVSLHAPRGLKLLPFSEMERWGIVKASCSRCLLEPRDRNPRHACFPASGAPVHHPTPPECPAHLPAARGASAAGTPGAAPALQTH